MIQLQKFSKAFTLVLVCLFFSGLEKINAQGMQALAPNYLHLPEKPFEIKITWKGDSLNGNWETHAALLLPVKLPGCPKQFYMQFDLGAPSTIFYKSSLQQIRSKYRRTNINVDNSSILADFSFQLGSSQIVADSVKVIEYQNPQINWKNKNSVEIIGTIGSDFIENRLVIFDFKGNKLFNGTTMPLQFAEKVKLTDFIYARRTVLLPSVIKGKKSLLYFDTGSSAYALLTDKNTAESLTAPDAVSQQHSVRSWDRNLIATTFTTNDSIEIAFNNLPIQKVTYMQGASDTQVAQMMKMGIAGMTGNKLFIGSILVLDTKNKKFGIIN